MKASRALHWLVVVCVFSVANSTLANPTPKESLEHILASDFRADTEGRIDRVEFTTPGREHPRREVLLLQTEPFEVIRSFKVLDYIGETVDSMGHANVQFMVCASTSGVGTPTWINPHGREIVPFDAARPVTLSYKMVERGNSWLVVDPPNPMIGRDSLISYFSNELNGLSDALLLNKLREVGGHALENNTIIRDWLKRQISVLRSLNC